jgi:hypothetical protein
VRACHPHPAATKPDCIQVSDDLPLLVRRAWTANATRWPRRAFLGGAAFVGRPGQQTFPLAQRRAGLTVAMVKDLADKSAALKQWTPHIKGRPNQALRQTAGHDSFVGVLSALLRPRQKLGVTRDKRRCDY